MDKTLYQNVQSKPKKKIALVTKPSEMKVCLYENDEDKLETLQYLSQLHLQTDSSRPHQNWDLRLKQYDAKLMWNEDGTANVNLPIEDATIRNKIADEEAQKPIVEFIPTNSEDAHKVDLIKALWNYVWIEGDTDKELTKMRYCKNIFGSAVWFEGIRRETYTRYEPVYGDGGKITGKPVTETKSWIAGKMIDLRNVWIDPVADIEDAKYCFILENNLSRDQIASLKEDPNFNKEAVDKLLERTPQLQNTAANSLRPFLTDKEMNDNVPNKYALMHYYDKDKGMYIVTDDTFSIVLREGPNPFPHGELPISFLVDHPKYMEMYGRGECEMLESTKYERNTTRNQIIDSARASNTINFAVGQGVSFEQSELISGVMRIWNFNGNLNDAQFIKPPSQDSNLYNVDNILKGDATWITGIDVNSLVGQGSKTALEARLQEQTKLKGIFVSLRQFDYFMVRMARQRLANIQAFLPKTTGKLITEGEMKGKYRTIALTDSKIEDVNGIDENGKIKKKGVKLTKKEGHTEFFQLTPQKIKCSLGIQVRTPTTTPILQELNKYDLRELFKSWIEIAQVPQFGSFLDRIDIVEYAEDRIREMGFDPDRYIKEGDEEEKETKELRASVLGDIPAPPHAMSQPTKSRLIPPSPMALPQGMPGVPGQQLPQ